MGKDMENGRRKQCGTVAIRLRGRRIAAATVNVVLAIVLVVGLAPGVSLASYEEDAQVSDGEITAFDQAVEQNQNHAASPSGGENSEGLASPEDQSEDAASQEQQSSEERLADEGSQGQSGDEGQIKDDSTQNPDNPTDDTSAEPVDAVQGAKAASAGGAAGNAKKSTSRKHGLATQDDGAEKKAVLKITPTEGKATSQDLKGVTYFTDAGVSVTVEATVSTTSLNAASALVVKPAGGEEVKSTTWTADAESGTQKASVSVSADGVYTVTLDVKDGDNNAIVGEGDSVEGLTFDSETGVCTATFGIDTSAPTVSIAHPGSGASHSVKGVDMYAGGTVELTATVQDPAFDAANSKVVVKRANGAESTYPTDGQSPQWVTSGSEHSLKIASISEEDDYDVSVTAQDVFGHVATSGITDKFAIDSTPPVVDSVELSPDSGTAVKTIDGIDYYDGPVKATITMTEPHFDASKMSLTLSGTTRTVTANPSTLSAVSSWSPTADGKQTADVIVSGDGPCTIEVKGADALGNSMEEAKKRDVRLDSTAPTSTMTKEDEKAGPAAGQKVVRVKVTATVDEANFEQGTFRIFVKKVKDDQGQEVNVEAASVAANWKPDSDGKQVAEVILGEGSDFGPGTYNVTLEGADPVGRKLTEGEEGKTLLSNVTIDSYEPMLRVEVNNNAEAKTDGDLYYYSASTLPTIVFKILASAEGGTFDSGKVTLNDGWNDLSSVGWTDNQYTLDLASNADLESLAEGKRTVSLTSSDSDHPLSGIGVSGNKWQYEFVYDKTAPAVKGEPAFANGTVVAASGDNPSYVTGSAPTMKLTVEEANFDASKFEVTAVRATDDTSEATSDPTVADTWGGTGDEHTIDVNFPGEGKFTVKVAGEDKAGNQLETWQRDIYVDNADPTLLVEYEDQAISGGSANQFESRKATITIAEENFDASAVKINEATYELAKWQKGVKDGKTTWTYGPVEYGSRDMECSLTVEGADALGRPLVYGGTLSEAEKMASGKYECEFLIDAAAPVLKIESAVVTEVKPADGVFANGVTEFTIHVKEGNFVAPTVKVGGEAKTDLVWAEGSNDDHYATVMVGEDGENLDGEYSLTVTGVDKVGRALVVSDNDAATANWFDSSTHEFKIEFSIDTVAPEVSSVSVTPAANGIYRYGQAEVVVKIVEANFREAGFTLNVSSLASPSVTWRHDADTNEHTGTFALTSDGSYSVAFGFKDKANNSLANKTVSGATYSASDATYSLATIGVDTRAPQLSVEVPAEVTNGYYNESTPAQFRITITEANFDPTRIVVNGAATSASQWGGSGTTHTLAYTFDEKSGSQQLTISGVDMAGRALEGASGTAVSGGSYQSKSFIVDHTSPKLSVSLSAAADEKYASESLVATLIVTELNFDPGLILVDGKPLDASRWTDGPEATHTAIVEYADDGSHVLTVSGADAATNLLMGDASTLVKDGTYTSSEVIVDNIDPKLTVKMKTPLNGKYYNSDVVIEATIEEANFSTDAIKVSARGSKSQSWSNSGTTHKLTVVYSNEGQDYSFSISGADLAGRKLVSGDDGATKVEDGTYKSINFVIDKTRPVVKIALSQPVAVQAYRGNDYFKKALTLRALVTVDDKNFDVSADDAHRSDDVIALSGTPVNSYSSSGWGKNKMYTVPFGPNDDLGDPSDLTVKVYDLAGNSVTYSYGETDARKGSTVDSAGETLTGKSFLLDVAAPRIEPGSGEDIPTRRPSNDYEGTYKGKYLFFSNPTTMRIKVVDELGVSSVKQVGDDSTYSIAVAGRAGDTSRMVTVKLENGKVFTKNFVLHVVDTAGNWREWKINPKKGKVSDVTDSSPVNTTLYGDESDIYPIGAILDTVNPKVAFANKVKAGAYYNTAQSDRLSIEELNFQYLASYEGATPVLTITEKSGDASRAQSTKVVNAAKFTPADVAAGSYYYDVKFDTDGHYSMQASFSDPAGNRSNTAEIGEFTIDTTAPRVEVTWDNTSAINGRYYAAGRSATIIVTEHNFSAGLIDVATNGSVGSWSTDGDRHTVTVSFSSDGTYDLSVTGRDLAGNALPAYTADQFVVDMTAPSVSISFAGASEGQRAFNDLVSPIITFSDEANYDSAGASFTLRGNKTGDVQYNFSRVADGNGETVTYADFAHMIDVDDIYTLTATLSDLAGNQAAEVSETFSVNRFGSNFIVESPKGISDGSSDLGYLSEAPDITIREINVSGIVESSVAVTHNLKTTNLDRKYMTGEPGYVLRDVGERANYGWQEFDYVISKESFASAAGGDSPDGNYVVVLSSKDSTGNTNSSANFWVSKNDERKSADAGEEETDTEKRMSAAVKFTLDTLPPEVVGLSVENNEIIDAAGEQEVTFIATDNIGFSEENGVDIIVDGQKADYAIDGSGKVSFVVPEQPGKFQSIQIQVVDFAGNKFMQGVIEDGQEAFAIKVSSDFFDLHMPLIIGGGIAVVVAAAAIGFFFVRPRMASRAARKTTVE